MLSFPYRLTRGEDPVTGYPVLGFEHQEKFIFDPFRSPDLEHGVSPLESYALSSEYAQQLKLANEQLVRATHAAVDSACTLLHLHFGLSTPKLGQADLSDIESSRRVQQALADYVLRKLQAAERAALVGADSGQQEESRSSK